MPGKILIIDDDNRNIFALKATLKAKGYECLSATSAQQGIAFLRETPGIGVVLLDMMMPDMDGYEALPAIRATHNIPVVAVTAQAMKGDREKCLEAGANDYVSKPIDVDRLELILKKYLN
ncbi:MAG: response regulator [Flavipsychrobacter sp.]|nr:response regulator [Flavipsychrobacter sp.]